MFSKVSMFCMILTALFILMFISGNILTPQEGWVLLVQRYHLHLITLGPKLSESWYPLSIFTDASSLPVHDCCTKKDFLPLNCLLAWALNIKRPAESKPLWHAVAFFLRVEKKKSKYTHLKLTVCILKFD